MFQPGLGKMVFEQLGGEIVSIASMFSELGQEKKFRCQQCDWKFFSHTHLTRVFKTLAIVQGVAVAVLVTYVVFSFFRH
jgi:hypothetical protein